jgi:methanogenic corrinoid protein MtbC1
MSFIQFSVGRGGVNLPADVSAVHAALDRYDLWDQSQSILFTKPKMSLMLEYRIATFQRRFAPFSLNNDLMLPNSWAANMLALYAASDDGPKVTYSEGVEQNLRLVSSYAVKVVQKALVAAKVSAAVITSTLRLPQKQAEIMYGYASKNLAQQYKLYGSAGDQVLKVFEDNQTKTKAEVIQLMTAKVEELHDKGIKVSNHVSTVAGYSGYNVFDIGVNSTKAKAGKTFNLAGLTKAFAALKKEGYITNFIDETGKTNNCWHLEITPDAKAL